MRWHVRTALASSFAPTSIVMGGGFLPFLPLLVLDRPFVLGDDVVLLSCGGGGGASLALGFFLRGFCFFVAFCASSPFMTSMTIVLSSSLLPFLGRGGMLFYDLSCGAAPFWQPYVSAAGGFGAAAFAGDTSVGSAAIAAIAQCRRDALEPQRERR